jgi:hypothetical protein
VTLTDRTAKVVPALAALRDLVTPSDGMIAIKLEDGRRVFAPAGGRPADVKRRSHRARPDHAGVPDPFLKAVDEDVVIEAVKELFQVDVHHDPAARLHV